MLSYQRLKHHPRALCTFAAIPAYAPKVLRDYGSEQLSERFDHPLVSFDVLFVIGPKRLSCGTQTSAVIEA